MVKRLQSLLQPTGIIGLVVFLLTQAYKVLGFWGNMDFLKVNLPAVAGFLGSVWGWLSVTAASVLLIVGALFRTPPTAQVGKSPASAGTDAPKGILDFLVEVRKAPTELLNTLGRIGRENEQMGNRLRKHTERMNRTSSNPEAARRIAIDASADMDEFSGVLEKKSPAFAQHSSTLLDSWTGYFSSLSVDAYKTNRQQSLEFRGVVEQLLHRIVEFRASTLEDFRSATMGLRRSNLSQALNQSSDRLEKSLGRMQEILRDTETGLRKLLRVIDKKMKEGDSA